MIASIRNAVQVIECFTADRPEVGITEIAGLLGMNKSTVHHIVETLTCSGVLVRTDRRKYRLGIRVVEWAAHTILGEGITPLARPYLERLAQQFSGTARLAGFDHGQVVCLDKIEPAQIAREFSPIGMHAPAYCTALGKAILAFQSDQMVSATIEHGLVAKTPRTISNADCLRRELARIRKTGYAMDREEWKQGIVCIGVPLLGYQDRASYAISIAGPAHRLTENVLPRLVTQLQHASSSLSVLIKDAHSST